MGVMKRNLFIVLALFMAVSISANAAVTPEQLTDPEYVINSGFSEATAEEIMIMKNRVDGKPCEPLYDKKQNKAVRWLKKFYAGIDPAIDSEERLHHDIKQSPSFTDL